VGRAQTRGDSIVFVPQDRIAYLSELYFADQFLFINDATCNGKRPCGGCIGN